MRYYEVFVADAKYRASTPLIYHSEDPLELMNVVTVPLRNRLATGFVTAEIEKPDFSTKAVKSLLSPTALPMHCLELARWLQHYYHSSLGETLKLFTPTRPVLRRPDPKSTPSVSEEPSLQLELTAKLTKTQQRALEQISQNPSTTVLLHGDTGTGKTRVYLELAKKTLGSGRSVIILTPEIALTPQLALAAEQQLNSPTYILHSQLTAAKRKKIWLEILEAKEPVVVIGPRSALFSPLHSPGLIVIDEAHEPAYKQDQSPRYHANRVASQLGLAANAKVVLGTATPSVAEYYLASERGAVVRMSKRAIDDSQTKSDYRVIDLKHSPNFSQNRYLANKLIDAISSTLSSKKQAMVYLNRRGSARLILCNNCGWQMLCPNCDIPLVYHADHHSAHCHICGFSQRPPSVCPECKNPDIIYLSIGTKALAETVTKLFPAAKVRRFDSDNTAGERIHEIYHSILNNDVDILVGTQLLAKGLDLPRLGLVGVIDAETSLALPDYSSEERSFQLLYQIIGRVGRGHGRGEVIIQSHDPESLIIHSAAERNYEHFYEYTLAERRKFRFPPFSYLMQLTCRRATLRGVEQASQRLKDLLVSEGLPVEINGPAPSFYARRGRYHYWQMVIKSKQRDHLLALADKVPSDWSINLDPLNLL
jgi:primosomal protein N' (replication factor Y)